MEVVCVGEFSWVLLTWNVTDVNMVSLQLLARNGHVQCYLQVHPCCAEYISTMIDSILGNSRSHLRIWTLFKYRKQFAASIWRACKVRLFSNRLDSPVLAVPPLVGALLGLNVRFRTTCDTFCCNVLWLRSFRHFSNFNGCGMKCKN